MKVWYLNVGHGDCTIIQHPSGRITMIDINNSQSYDPESHQALIEERQGMGALNRLLAPQAAQTAALSGGLGGGILGGQWEEYAALMEAERRELTDPIAFFKETFPGQSIFRFILTHPDMDHMRGIKNLFSEIYVENFWDTRNNKKIENFNSSRDKEDWEFYQYLRSGQTHVQVNNYTRGYTGFAINKDADGSGRGDGIYVLSPPPDLVRACNANGKFNDISIVFEISCYGRTLTFAGDAETLAWDEMVRVYGPRDLLKTDVLKASHHGRDSGFHLRALQALRPDVTIVSVGRKPSTDAHQKYHYHSGTRVLSTRRHGNIQAIVKPDGEIDWFVDRNAD
jgi:competence protein ComEC